MKRLAIASALAAILCVAPAVGAGSGEDAAGVACPTQTPAGGLIVCEGPPGAEIYEVAADDRAKLRAITDATGLAVVGVGRAPSNPVTLRFGGAASGETVVAFTPRDDPYREITGLDCDKVDARTPAQKDHAGRSWVKKQKAFKTFHPPTASELSFVSPAKGPFSSPFGPTRKYIGISKVTGEPCESMSVHRGLDIATPVGTDLVAPMAGVVTLADPDLYYEGGTIFLDHGRGLKSVFLHLSEVDVAAGQEVAQGERLGATGNTGRTTGPHLHWAVKWRNETADDRSGDFYIDPKLLLEMSQPG